jgi:hypothetical protein
MKRQVYFYHYPDSKAQKIIEENCEKEDDLFFYSGSLDDFAKFWPYNFALMGRSGTEYIAITTYNSWGAR